MPVYQYKQDDEAGEILTLAWSCACDQAFTTSPQASTPQATSAWLHRSASASCQLRAQDGTRSVLVIRARPVLS